MGPAELYGPEDSSVCPAAAREFGTFDNLPFSHAASHPSIALGLMTQLPRRLSLPRASTGTFHAHTAFSLPFI